MLQGLPATEKRLQQIQQAQKEDAICCKLIKYCQEGWPENNLVPDPVKHYIHASGELTVENDLLLKGSRIIIRVSLQLDMLEKLQCSPGNTQVLAESSTVGVVAWIKPSVDQSVARTGTNILNR